MGSRNAKRFYYSFIIIARFIRIFLFQAEDGIRHLVRSRGLGDVYKRQLQQLAVAGGGIVEALDLGGDADREARRVEAVSYTHLTLSTSDPV